VQAGSTNSHRNGRIAQVSRPDGQPLPTFLRALRSAFARGPRPLQALLELATPRLVAPRLPDLLFRYEDGRSFHLPADSGPYAQIFTRGEFEPGESDAVRALVRPGDFVVDVGANLGWFSLVMAETVGSSGEVWAVEPMPLILPALKRNLALNESLQVRLFEVALGEASGATEIHVFSGLPHGHASVSTLDRQDYISHQVGRRTLDDLLGGLVPAFVKVDVEGSELAVLRGARATLAADCPPLWMVEVNYETSASFGFRPVDLLSQLGEANRVFRITEGGLVPETEPEAAPNGSNWVIVPTCHEDRVPA
jgi:FkbM family methyltransferase